MLRTSLRAGGTAPISLFAFQDIIFSATGVFLLIAILMTLFGKIDMISTEALTESEHLREQLSRITERQLITERKLRVLSNTTEANRANTDFETQAISDVLPENIWLYGVSELLQHNRLLRKTTDMQYQDLAARITEMNRKEHRLELLQAGAYQSIEAQGSAIVRKGPAYDFREPVFITLDAKGLTITYPGRKDLNQTFDAMKKLTEYISGTFTPKTQTFLIHVKPSGIEYFEPLKTALRGLDYSLGYEPVLEEFMLE